MQDRQRCQHAQASSRSSCEQQLVVAAAAVAAAAGSSCSQLVVVVAAACRKRLQLVADQCAVFYTSFLSGRELHPELLGEVRYFTLPFSLAPVLALVPALAPSASAPLCLWLRHATYASGSASGHDILPTNLALPKLDRPRPSSMVGRIPCPVLITLSDGRCSRCGVLVLPPHACDAARRL